MEIVITAILSLIGAVIATIVATYLYDTKIRDRIYVKRVLDMDDVDIPRLLELYVDLFPEESCNYSSDDIVEMIEHQSHGPEFGEVTAEDFILVAKYKGDVIGFLFCHYYPERKKAIISYYGIDKSVLEARRKAAHALLKSLKKHLSSKGRVCDYIFFDVDPPETALNDGEKVRRRARISVLKQSARAFQVKAYFINFEYMSPKITMADVTKETPLNLMVVPMSGRISNPISKENLLEFLRFIYMDCYGDYYEVTDPKYKSFRSHLFAMLRKYKKTLPTEVSIS